MIKGEVDHAIKRIQRKLPPGYLGIPIYREIKFLCTVGKGTVKRALWNDRLKYGTLFTNYQLGRINIALCGQDDLAWLFNNDRKGLTVVSRQPPVAMLFGPKSLLNNSGHYHRTLRRMMEPYFAPKFVSNYFKIVDETTTEILDKWASSDAFLSSEVFKLYALKVFYASSFGRVDDEVITPLHDDLTIWLNGAFTVSTKRIPGTNFDEGMKARDRILNTFDHLIDEFMRENPAESDRAQTTVMGRLVYCKDKENNQMMTRDEMKDNMLALAFAGHDTAYASISSLLYHLSQNPDTLEALVEETSSLSEPLEAGELKNAPVLNACMYESWRVDPPVLGASRKATKDIGHKGYSFDAGSTFFYSIISATTDESIYKNHDKFDMRRFLPKDHPLYQSSADSGIDPVQGRINYPIFGGGAHVCLGKSFAQLELRVLFARITRHYHFEVRNPSKVHFPFNGWKVEFKLTKRKDI